MNKTPNLTEGNVQDKIKNFTPIVKNIGEHLNISIDQLQSLIVTLVNNETKLGTILEKDHVKSEDCEYIKGTISEMVNIIIEQKTHTEETVDILEIEQEKVGQVYSEMTVLKEKAYKDRTTGLYNRYKFDELIEGLESVYNKHKNHKQYSLGFLEISNLTIINEKFGPDVGNEMMKVFSYILWNRLGKKGLAFHFQGNEFIILMKSEPKEVYNYISEIQETFEELEEIPSVFESLQEKNKREGYDVFKDELKTLQYTFSLMKDVYDVQMSFSGGIFKYKGENPNTVIDIGQDIAYQAKNEKNTKLLIKE